MAMVGELLLIMARSDLKSIFQNAERSMCMLHRICDISCEAVKLREL